MTRDHKNEIEEIEMYRPPEIRVKIRMGVADFVAEHAPEIHGVDAIARYVKEHYGIKPSTQTVGIILREMGYEAPPSKHGNWKLKS